MSATLGPIHHWLYRKIHHQEALTGALAQLALERGWLGLDEARSYAVDLPDLEEAIDGSNIHGWLQERINLVEQNYAQLVTSLLREDYGRLDLLREAAGVYGARHSLEPDLESREVYRHFEDFFLNGMPCERVNRLVEDGGESLTWEQSYDIHAAYWADCPQGSAPYYELRLACMRGLLERSPWQVDQQDGQRYTLRKLH